MNDWFDKYDDEFGDDKQCRCGHPYYRHFDTYEDMRHVGCKYCDCHMWRDVNGVGNYVEVFDVHINIRLSDEQMRSTMRTLNMAYLGRPELKDFMERLTKAHDDAAYAVCRGLLTSVKVAVRRDGHKEVIK